MSVTTAAESKAVVLTPDICVIGAGPAGLGLAISAAAFGVSVVLVERERMNGTAPGAGGPALRALVAAGDRADALRQAGRFGIGAGAGPVDYARVHDHLQRVVAAGAPDRSQQRLGALGITLVEGQARFLSRSTVNAGGRTIRARRFVVATGARAVLPDVPGIDTVQVLTPEALFALTRKPERLLVLGGGAYGVAIAQAMARLGSTVTLVAGEGLLPGEDMEAVGLVRRGLLRDGVTLHDGVAVTRVEAMRGGVRLTVAKPAAGETTIEAGQLLVADARRPDLAALDLDLGGIVFDEGGIRVDRSLRTGNGRVFAIGDCVAGAIPGAHVATRQAALVLHKALFRLPVRLDPVAVPRLVMSRPELATVGLSESRARAKAGAITVLRFPLSETDAARATGETAGFVKVIAGRKGAILGVTIVGAGAGELIAPWCLALSRKLTVQDMAELVWLQPTVSDASRLAATSFYAPMTARPGLRRLIGFLRRFG